MMDVDAIPSAVIKILWDVCAQRSTTTDAQARAALAVIAMAARAQPEIVLENTATLVAVGFGMLMDNMVDAYV